MAGAARDAIFAELMSEVSEDRTGRIGRSYAERLSTLRRQTARRLAAGAPRDEAAALKEIVAGLTAGEELVAAFRRRDRQ